MNKSEIIEVLSRVLQLGLDDKKCGCFICALKKYVLTNPDKLDGNNERFKHCLDAANVSKFANNLIDAIESPDGFMEDMLHASVLARRLNYPKTAEMLDKMHETFRELYSYMKAAEKEELEKTDVLRSINEEIPAHSR